MKNKKNLFIKLFCIATILYCTTFFAQNTYAEHTLSLSTSGSQEIDISSAGNRTSISEAEINVTTTCQAGYNLSLSTSISDNNLYLNGNPSNNEVGKYFSPSDGTTALISAYNTWGFYLPNSDNDRPTTNSVFSPVPALGNTAILRTPAQTASSSAIDDTFSIYYGVKVSSDLTAGAYTMTKDANEAVGSLVYYAILSEDCFRYTIKFDPTGTNTGEEITGTGIVENQIVAEGATTNLTENIYNNPTIDGVLYYFIGWNTAQDGTGVSYAPGQEITDLTTAGNSITLFAQWIGCPAGKVCYFGNHSDVEGSMESQEANSNTNITLLASNYLLSNHGFVGWSEDKTAAEKLANNESVTIYGPNETINSGDLSSVGKSLYAVWLEAEETLQKWTGCDDLEIGDVIALRDARDDNTYTVAKLSDGKCWTIENIRIDDSVDAQTMAFGSSSLGNDFDVLPASSENWSIANNTLVQFNNSNSTNGIVSYGNFYSWPAAVASSISYETGTTTVETSICPSGWRLPKGGQALVGTNNDYHILMYNLTGIEPNINQSSGNGYYGGADYSNSIRQYPNNFLYSGRWNANSASDLGESGFYWTATSYDTGAEAYYLYLNEDMVRPGNGRGGKYYGDSFRCIYMGAD